MVRTAESELRRAGLRVTPSRRAVYAVLEASDSPLSHGEVWARLDPRSLDRATVYRNLLALAEAGLVQRMDLGDHVWRFELIRGPHARGAEPGAHHPHFVCTECGTVECLDDVEVQVRRPGAGPRAVERQDVEVQLRGRCDDCTA